MRYLLLYEDGFDIESTFTRVDVGLTERDYMMDFDDAPIRIPVTDVVDLHTVAPRDVRPVVEEYLIEAQKMGFRALRIIHGRGIGAQRAVVRDVLSHTVFVESFGDAPMEAGGWGATVVTLMPNTIDGVNRAAG